MSHSRWTRHDDELDAVDKILDAAGRTFAELGMAKATMIEVARAAGCSRATLYRYFPNQEALHHAFVNRATLRIADQMETARRHGAPGSLADRILGGVHAVRSDPLLAVWFEPANMAVPIAVSQNSEVLHAMSAGLIGELSDRLTPAEIERRGEWLLRCIVSLLAMPGRDADEERALVESFVVPALIAEPTPTRTQGRKP